MHKVHLKESEELQHLLEGCLKKDRKSQELLYKQYYSYGMSIAFRYAGNKDEANEILNDSFMKVFQNLKKYDGNRSFTAWFRTIVINTSINQYKRCLKHSYQDDIVEAKFIPISQNALDTMAYEEILGLVQKLTPGYRTVFSLFVIDGHSHEEISKMLEISVGASKSNLSRARFKLQGMLEDLRKIEYAAVGG